mgnify:CR=1 FL=1
MNTKSFDILLSDLSDMSERIGRVLMEGGAKDYAEYKSLCGEIRGLSQAHMYITDLVRKMEQDDDE